MNIKENLITYTNEIFSTVVKPKLDVNGFGNMVKEWFNDVSAVIYLVIGGLWVLVCLFQIIGYFLKTEKERENTPILRNLGIVTIILVVAFMLNFILGLLGIY